MRLPALFLILLAALVVTVCPLYAEDLDARARAALAIAALPARAQEVPASDPFAPPKPADLDRYDYSACSRESIRTGRHLVLWQGYKCVSSEKQLPNAIHCFVEENTFPEFGRQVVVVAVPTRGQLLQSAVILPDDLCARTIKAGCAGTYQRDPQMATAMGGYRGG